MVIGPWTSVSWTFVDQCVVSGSNFLIGILVARLLGVEQFGIYTLGMMIVWLAQGLNNALVYAPMLSIAPKQDPAHRRSYFGAVVCHQAVVTVCFALAAMAAAVVFQIPGLENARGPLLFVAIAAGAAVMRQEFMRRYFYATHRPHLAVVNSVTAYGLQAIGLGCLFLWSSLTVVHVFVLTAICSGLAVTINTLKFDPIVFRRSAIIEITQRHWRMGKWLLASVFAYWGAGNVFYIAAGAILGPIAVGAMRAASLVLAVGHIVFQGLENVLPVNVANALHRHGWKAARRQSVLIGSMSCGAIVMISLIACAAPDLWFRLFFGQQYLGYEWLIYPYALLNPLIILFSIGAGMLRGLEDTRFVFFIWVAMAVVACISAAPVVQSAHIAGAVWGLVGVQALGTALVAVHVARVYRARRKAGSLA